ncbi:AAA family ATPase, partial [Pseudomonas gingeri]|uniref:AAA family ATPase n=2 Tax=Pseudomonas TaxID=286 RepID=UPI0015A450AE
LQFCNITAALEKISSKRDNILLLIDEGDAFLHLEWQRLYIQQLNDLLSGTVQSAGVSALQVIMATHSPLLATDVPKQFVCSLNEQQDGKTPKAFAATLHTLFNQSFKAKTIGEFASQRINEAVENYRNKNPDARDEAVIKSIDN